MSRVSKLVDVAHREDIGIDDDGAALIVHEFGRQEAHRREGLEIVVLPGAPAAGAQEFAALELIEETENLRGW